MLLGILNCEGIHETAIFLPAYLYLILGKFGFDDYKRSILLLNQTLLDWGLTSDLCRCQLAGLLPFDCVRAQLRQCRLLHQQTLIDQHGQRSLPSACHWRLLSAKSMAAIGGQGFVPCWDLADLNLDQSWDATCSPLPSFPTQFYLRTTWPTPSPSRSLRRIGLWFMKLSLCANNSNCAPTTS